jgi:transposase for insertion sequence element
MKIEFNQYNRDIVGIIKRLCKYKGVEIIEGHIMPDHIHLLLPTLTVLDTTKP